MALSKTSSCYSTSFQLDARGSYENRKPLWQKNLRQWAEACESAALLLKWGKQGDEAFYAPTQVCLWICAWDCEGSPCASAQDYQVTAGSGAWKSERWSVRRWLIVWLRSARGRPKNCCTADALYITYLNLRAAPRAALIFNGSLVGHSCFLRVSFESVPAWYCQGICEGLNKFCQLPFAPLFARENESRLQLRSRVCPEVGPSG